MTRGDAPVVDRALLSNLAWAGCGITWGVLGRTDHKGRILVPRFWYEGHDRLWLQDEAGKELWSVDPRGLDPNREIEVKLP